ncbi:hypothetical protein DPMN_149102 [Dreissena polymorpha]|uniref:Uncharacterized protein n=1 Tax=Dreissena polymorpha TaxID=45954 RepID=A0A9D4FB43_DREPO|nr:hypothetical protein DPMN_149102 [Dreissena polymorpha]
MTWKHRVCKIFSCVQYSPEIFLDDNLTFVYWSPQSGDVSSEGLADLFETLRQHTYIPQRQAQGPFLFSVDHCFSMRGQGTVLTGTALSGQLAVNDVSIM